MLRFLLDGEETLTAIDCQIDGNQLTVRLLGIQELSPEIIELIDKDTGDHFTILLPSELVNQPIYLVGENIPLTIISRTNP